MAIQFTQERFYPSVRKPGVFLINPNEDTEIWEQLTGIDNSAIDRFKFSLGSWVDVNNNNQKIILYPTSMINDDTFENIKSSLIGTVFGEQPADVFVGIPIVSTDSNLQINKDNLSFLNLNNLPIYHDKDSSSYSNTTAPLTIQFGVNYFKRFNENIDNVLVEPEEQDLSLPDLSFNTDVLLLNKTQRIFSNFDWYNDTVWRGGGGPNAPDDMEAGRHDDVISDIEGPPDTRERWAWQNSYLNDWHRFEYALPSFKGRHQLTQKYADARGTEDDVGGKIVYSRGQKIGISLDPFDPYTDGTPDNIDNNHIGINLEDLIGITKENMGSDFNPSDYSATGNMSSTAADISSPGREPFITLFKHKGDGSQNSERIAVHLFLKFNPDVYCPVDVRVGDRVAFNVIDNRNEAGRDFSGNVNGVRGSAEHNRHRGRRISRPPLGVGRQFEYTVIGVKHERNTTYPSRLCVREIILDVFMRHDSHFYTQGNSPEELFNIYTNDILPSVGPQSGDQSYNVSNANIIQIYRREDDFDEDDNNMPSIAHKDKLYKHYRRLDLDNDQYGNLYDVNVNSENIEWFNTHGRFGVGITNSYFKDIPVVDEFDPPNDLGNQQGRDPLRENNGDMTLLYQVSEDSTAYGRQGEGSLLNLQNNGLFKNSAQTNSNLDRLKNLYSIKSVIMNASVNMDHYSYRAFGYRELGTRSQTAGGTDGYTEQNGGTAGPLDSHFVDGITDWIGIHGYNSSVVEGDIQQRRMKHTLQDVLLDGVQVAASKNINNNDLDDGGFSTVSSTANSQLTLPKPAKNYKRNLVYATRAPCDFFIKYRMNDSDFDQSVLSGQENSLEIDLDDYDSRITNDGYVKISKSKFYQIIPDITVYNKKEAFVKVTVGVGAKRKGIADRNYLNSYNEVSFELRPSDQDWYNISKRLGGINKSPNGDDIRITDAGRYNGGQTISPFQHLTSKYFTAIQENESVIPFIRLSWHFQRNNSDWQEDTAAHPLYFVLGHIDMIELPYDFNAATTPQDLMSNYVKYHVLDWGDSSEPMTEDKIRQTEFFSIYDQEPDDIDKFQVKNLMQTVEIAKPIYENGILNLTSHTYTEPGVKNIKTLIFKLDENGTAIYETIVMNTSIVVNSVDYLLQDFNTFGASEFNVLPLSATEKELIIGGGIDSDSNYVSSLEAIDTNNIYESDDFIEKNYYETFKKNLDSGSYGENINLDLATVRFFNKPKNLYDFITDDIDKLIQSGSIENLPTNSSATDIFINNTDCKIELGMNDANGIMVENTSNSNESGILIGDYSLIKEEGEDIKKEDEMDIPEFETDSTKQAF